MTATSEQDRDLRGQSAETVSSLSDQNLGQILIVDDEVELKNALVETLTQQGYLATGYTSGREALDALRERNVDILLSDLMMPELDGIDLLREAMEIDPHLVCIIMTGQGTIQTAVDAMKIGAFDYVLKPFRLHTLLPTLTRAINSRRLRQENLQLRETVAIYELSQTIAFTLDPQTVLSKLADAALQQSGGDEVSILLPTTDGRELYVAAVRGENRERLLGERVPFERSISSWVARERQPVLLKGEVDDARFTALWPRPDIRSAISVPMQIAGKLVGVININTVSNPRPFRLGQMKALTILASTAAAALESASLYEQVRLAEKNYRSIFENAVEGIFQSTDDKRFLKVNPALATILGYDSPEEVVAAFTDIGKQLYVDPELSAYVTKMLEDRGEVQGIEFEAYRKNREKTWLSLNVRVVRDKLGIEIFREGTIEDISERKRAEAERLATFEIIQGVITTRNLDELFKLIHKSIGRILYANNCFVALHDETTDLLHFEYWADQFDSVPAPRMPGKGFSTYVLRTNRPLLLTEQIRNELYASGEVEKSGHTSASWLGVPLGTPSRPIGVLVVQHYEDKNAYSQQDLEFLASVGDQIALAIERKQADKALQETLLSKAESLALLDTILSTAPIGFAFHDRELRYVRINESLAAINGLPIEQHIGRTLRDVLPEMADVLEPLLHRVLETGQPVKELELSGIAHAGASEKRHWVVSFYPVQGGESELLGVGVLVSEITGRKRVEEALRESEERYRVVAETATDVIITIDQDSNILFTNRAVERVFGYSASELLGKKLTVLMPENLRSLHRAGMNRYLHTGEKHINWESVELPGLHKSGREIPLELSFGAFSKDDKEYFTGIGRDITERKRAAEKLRRSEEQYRDLVENARDMIYTHDLLGNYTSINRAGELITGYTRDETLKMNIADSVAPECLEKAKEMLAGKIAGNEETIYDLDVIAKDGRRITVEVNTRLVYQNSVPIGVQGIARDITERKRLEEMVQRRAARAALRADTSAALADSKSSLQTILKRCAEAAVQHLGAALARIWTFNKDEGVLELQASAGMYTHIDGPHGRVAIGAFKIGLIAQERQPLITNEVLTDPRVSDKAWAKREGMVAFAGYPLIVEDRLIGVMAMFARQPLADDTIDALASVADIISQGIERKRAEEALQISEEQLRQSQKLEAVGQLAGGVAHDFNNLLTVITGYSDLLLRGLKQDDAALLKVQEIKKAGERAASLTRQLLAFSRKQVLQPRLLNLNFIVSDVEKMLRRLIGEDIDLLTVLDPALGHIKADPGQIEQVILNLSINARDAMPLGGQLTIETSNIYLDSKYATRHTAIRPGNYVMLAVSDTGTGMDAETQAHMFEPFFTTKVQGKGTGLGLSTVYGIVKQSDGNVWVYSELGKGTTFKVYLPRVDEAGQLEIAPVTTDQLPQGRETVLLSEDEEPVRRLTTLILEANGYKVFQAGSGEEALAVFEEHADEIQLIITDVVMPKMSGRELAQTLAPMNPTLKVLYLSGYTDDAIVRHGLLDQKMAFLQKPFTPDSLLRKIRELLDSVD